jgi:SAM-dependent methyltransferase
VIATGEPARLFALLACPRCGTSPQPALAGCPGCGRSIVAPGGGLDLLDDAGRVEADRFASQYRTMRIKEGWADSSGKEGPAGRPLGRWKHRLNAVSGAAAILARELTAQTRPVVADIGSGGGWAAQQLRGADVIAFDLLDARPTPGALTVRADMLKLPLRNGTMDATLYAASLHYGPVAGVIGEAARVLRPGGLMVAVDSPIYHGRRSHARAVARTTSYYTKAGYPELARHYHPIEVGALRAALSDTGFQVEHLDVGRPGGLWQRLARRPPSSLVVARFLH